MAAVAAAAAAADALSSEGFAELVVWPLHGLARAARHLPDLLRVSRARLAARASVHAQHHRGCAHIVALEPDHGVQAIAACWAFRRSRALTFFATRSG